MLDVGTLTLWRLLTAAVLSLSLVTAVGCQGGVGHSLRGEWYGLTGRVYLGGERGENE